MSRRLYTLDDAAEQLSIGRTKLDELVSDGKLETVTIGRRRLVPDVALEEFVARLRKAS